MKPVFAFGPTPGATDFAIYVDEREYDAVLERGFATLDHVRCTPVLDACARTIPNCFLRMRLEEPYRL